MNDYLTPSIRKLLDDSDSKVSGNSISFNELSNKNDDKSESFDHRLNFKQSLAKYIKIDKVENR